MKLVGQGNLLNYIDTLIEENRLAQFTLIRGRKGSGKKLIAEYVANKLNPDIISVVPNKLESIQNMIDTARAVSGRVVFLLFDIDTLSVQAKNALLKILEEPPKNVYFIITASAYGVVPDTICSRASIVSMQSYRTSELVEYAKLKNPNIDDNALSIITSICEVPDEVNQLLSYDVFKFNDYVKSVVNNIAVVSGANSFKIADKLAIKDESDKYDIILFLRAFQKVCLDEGRFADTLKYLNMALATNDYIFEMQESGANKQMLVDNWILDVRKAWK